MKKVGLSDRKTFIIAELSANHNHDIQVAVRSLEAAKRAGADAVKIQLYTPDTLTIDVDNKYFKVHHKEWGGQTLYSLYQKAYMPWDWVKTLKKKADKLGVAFFSTSFDKTAVDFLEDMDCPIHKIASFELVDLPLIEYVAGTKKPLILSTGMATLREVQEAVETARSAGAKNITLLKCVSNYPAKPENMNLRSLLTLKEKFSCQVGLSDHTMGSAVSVAAVSLGASVIEKHFTLSRKMKTPDSFFSMEPAEWKSMVDDIRVVEQAMGSRIFGRVKDECASLMFRRSLFVIRDIAKGEVFTEEHVRSIRPGQGLPPKYLSRVIGRRAKCNLRRGEPLRMDMVGASL